MNLNVRIGHILVLALGIFTSPCWAEKNVVSVPDSTPPIFNAKSTTANVKDANVHFAAKVTDNRGVESVYLYFRDKGTQTYHSVSMTDVSSDMYSASIPITEFHMPWMEYYIVARDINGNVAQWGKPTRPFFMEIGATENAGTKATNQQKTLIESMQEKPRSKTPTWVWLAIGSLVAGGTAVAIENNQSDKSRGAGVIVVSTPLP